MLAKGRAEFQQGRDFSRVCSKNTGGSRKHESTIKARQMAAAREYFRRRDFVLSRFRDRFASCPVCNLDRAAAAGLLVFRRDRSYILNRFIASAVFPFPRNEVRRGLP
jgi:hypothetical protein